VVTLGGQDFYLGKHGSDASHQLYRRLVSNHLAGRPLRPDQGDGTTVAELVAAYNKHAKSYYRKAGQETSEVASIRAALRYVVEVAGTDPAASFDVLTLRDVREAMVSGGHVRTAVNQNVSRVVRAFRWATTEKLYPGALLAELDALPGLRRGRTAAAESAPVEPVDDTIVAGTLPHLAAVVADMVRLQRLTGMRPGEVVLVRPCDVDRSGDVWIYRPESHKTEHHGKGRAVLIGPKGQDVLRPYLLRPDDEFCFRSDRGAAVPRKRRRYRRDTYSTAVARACRKAYPVPEKATEREAAAHKRRHWWSPNQLRHTFGTEARRLYGLEAAQVLLGHASADVTQVYAERDLAKGAEAARLIG
jgi:integrase